SPQVWQQVAAILSRVNNIIGYDLINEPYIMLDQQVGIEDLSICDRSSEIGDLLTYYGQMLDVIRREDHHTPVIIESSFWANWRALRLLNLKQSPLSAYIHDIDLFKVSFHMYEPRLLTTYRLNKNRFGYPGISRNTPGASVYLQDTLNECHKHGWSTCLYAFREYHWSMMNYELGVDRENEHIKSVGNPLMKAITEAIQKSS
ncbi:unnamed protein product, partial [Adineta steineri]